MTSQAIDSPDNGIFEDEIEIEKPGLGIKQVGDVLKWIEDLVTALAGYAITFSLAVGVIDLLTDGQLVEQNPWITFAYAVGMATGLTGQLVACSYKASRNYVKGAIAKGVGFTILALILACVEFQAGIIFGFHQAFGTSVDDSIASLGLTKPEFIEIRTFVAVGLTLMSGFLRYQVPSKRLSIEAEKREIARRTALSIAKMEAQKEKTKALLLGVKSVARATTNHTDPASDITPESNINSSPPDGEMERGSNPPNTESDKPVAARGKTTKKKA